MEDVGDVSDREASQLLERSDESEPLGDQARMARCLDLVEDFCLVTESVRSGTDVDVDVLVETPSREGVEA